MTSGICTYAAMHSFVVGLAVTVLLSVVGFILKRSEEAQIIEASSAADDYWRGRVQHYLATHDGLESCDCGHGHELHRPEPGIGCTGRTGGHLCLCLHPSGRVTPRRSGSLYERTLADR